MRIGRLAWLFFKVGSLNELQYRANFFIQLLQSAVSVGVALVVLASSTRRRPSSTAGASRS